MQGKFGNGQSLCLPFTTCFVSSQPIFVIHFTAVDVECYDIGTAIGGNSIKTVPECRFTLVPQVIVSASLQLHQQQQEQNNSSGPTASSRPQRKVAVRMTLAEALQQKSGNGKSVKGGNSRKVKTVGCVECGEKVAASRAGKSRQPQVGLF